MLFDDNLGFITYNFDSKMMLKEANITSTDEGFARGNMFNNLYKPYKNYRYFKIMPKNRQEELLLEIMELSFAINDLGLYLDVHPDDKETFNKFRILVEKSCQKEMEYVKNFGPLEMMDDDNSSKYTWIKNPWPWENDGGVKYV